MKVMKKKVSRANLFRKAKKLWQILRLALVDLAWVEKRKDKFIVNMLSWYTEYSEVCHVCLAGCVMARSFNSEIKDILADYEQIDLDKELVPSVFRDDDEVENKLLALNDLRNGLILDAWSTLHPDSDPSES